MDWTPFQYIVRPGGRSPGPAGSALQLRIITDGIEGEGSLYFPILKMPLKFRLSPVVIGPQRHPFQLLEVGWELRLEAQGVTLAFYRSGPLFFGLPAGKDTSEEHYAARIALAPNLIQNIEDTRHGRSISLELWQPWAVLKANEELVCVGLQLNEAVPVRVPQSEWVERVLEPWGYGKYSLLELNLRPDVRPKAIEKAYRHILDADRHFQYGNDDDVLAAVYKAFESISKNLGTKAPDRSAFQQLLKGRVDKRVADGAAEVIQRLCEFMHIGRHAPEETRVPACRREAEFALNMGKSALVYLSRVLTKSNDGP